MGQPDGLAKLFRCKAEQVSFFTNPRSDLWSPFAAWASAVQMSLVHALIFV